MIIGNLGRDPEMRYTPSGQAVTQFTVAVNRNYKDQQGERQEETEWFRVVVWGQQAEFAAEYLRKGDKVYVEGRIQTRQWEGQDGQKRYTTELVANTDPEPRAPCQRDDGGVPGDSRPAARSHARRAPPAPGQRQPRRPSSPSPTTTTCPSRHRLHAYERTR